MTMKALFLCLLLCMISTVNAGLELHINGNSPVNSQIWVDPIEPIELSVFITDGTVFTGYDLSIVLGGNGYLDGSNTFFYQFGSGDFGSNVIVDMPEEVRVTNAGEIFPSNDSVTGPFTIFDNVFVNFTEQGDMTVSLIAREFNSIGGEPIPCGAVLDEVVIHQIPEPATLVLMGLGELILRRKK